MKKCLLLFILIFLGVTSLYAEVLFEENFDAQNDWFPQTEEEGCSDSSCIADLPSGWNFYRNDELWHPNTDGEGFHPTIQISDENYKGASGKAFTVWNESNSGRSSDGWGADGILAKDLGDEYDEIYIRFAIKYKSGFARHWAVGNSCQIKTFRIYHWDRSGSPFQFFTAGNCAPLGQPKINQNEYGASFGNDAMRCDPQATNYYCDQNYSEAKAYFVDSECGAITYDDTSPPHTDTSSIALFDNEWHIIQFHVKLNSAAGINDGEYDVWQDGCLVKSLTNVQWIGSDGDIDAGWNIVAFGGNAYNTYSDPENQDEQWYAIDDVIITTTEADLNGSPATTVQCSGSFSGG